MYSLSRLKHWYSGAAVLLIIILAMQVQAAEIRTFAYNDLVKNKLQVPPVPGVIYHLNRSRVNVDLTLNVIEEITKEVNDEKGKTAIVSQRYYVALDKQAQNTIDISIEDDPDLTFYLISKGGFMTDIKNGQVQFAPNSGSVVQIGVEYEDKTAQVITGTIKLAAETAGLVIGTQNIPKSATESRVIERTTLEDISFHFLYSTPLCQKIKEDSLNNMITIDLNDALANPQKKLLEKLNKRQKDLMLLEVGSDDWVTISATIEVSTGDNLPFAKLSAHNLLEKMSDNEDISETVTAHYLPGIIYRIPGNAVVGLYINGEPVVERRVRLPEAGQLGFYEFKSRLFSKISPSVEFDNEGSLKTVKFANTPATDVLLAQLQESKDSASKLLQDIAAKNDADAKKKAVADKAAKTKLADDAKREYKIETLRADIESLNSEITELQKKLAQAEKQEDKDTINQSLRDKRKSLRLKEKQLALLRKGMDIEIEIKTEN